MSVNETLLRIVAFVALALIFSISATFRRKARQSGDVIRRREEGTVVLALRMVFGLFLLLSLLSYVFYPPLIEWSRVALPGWLRWLASIMAILCVPFAWWVFKSIGDNISETVLTKRTHQLITVGPYRWIRHPLYAVAILLLFSISVMASSWFLALWPLFTLVVFRLIVIPKEEEFLIGAFGDQYLSYRHHTGALFPKVFGAPAR